MQPGKLQRAGSLRTRPEFGEFEFRLQLIHGFHKRLVENACSVTEKMRPVTEQLVARSGSCFRLVQQICPGKPRVLLPRRDTDAVIELPTSRGTAPAEQRPQPGRYEVEAVTLPLEHELGMQREMRPATRAEFTVNQRSGDLAGSAANLAVVTTILP